jgi:malonate transporter and related proteins
MRRIGSGIKGLFALGVTVALRPLRRMPWEVPVVLAVKLIIHPVMALLFLSLLGPFSDVWAIPRC